MDNESIIYWIALRSIEDLGCVAFRNLLKYLSTPREVFSASRTALKQVPGIGPILADKIKSFNKWLEVEEQINQANKLGVEIITCDNELYPRNLLNIYDYPPYLYVRGTLKKDEPLFAIVGSRIASAYGLYVTDKFSREFARLGITIVSGLARGIDTAAHKGAIAGRGRTIAVMGCGLDVTYPPENKELLEMIAKQGAVLTEYPFGTPPNATNFPNRNRIISGMSMGVLVVEAGEKSGSLITARIAADQGRSVFAVPGTIDTSGSRGTNKLIKEGAKLVDCIEDILEEITPQYLLSRKATPSSVIKTQEGTSHQSDNIAQERSNKEVFISSKGLNLLSFITERPIDLEELVSRSGLNLKEVMSSLLILEVQGLIQQLPGKKFVRKE